MNNWITGYHLSVTISSHFAKWVKKSKVVLKSIYNVRYIYNYIKLIIIEIDAHEHLILATQCNGWVKSKF